jgi:hypothetical protein
MLDSSAPKTSERRAAVRHLGNPRNRDCEVEAAEKEERWQARVRDISQSGMALIVARPIDPGTLLEVELEPTVGRQGIVLSMRVVHIRRHEKRWLLGCELEIALGPEDLARLV